MRGLASILVFLACVVLPPAAVAKEPRANPVVWEPDDATAGEPIDIVFTLSAVGSGARDDVTVVIHGDAGKERFRAIPFGSGRYGAAVTFAAGGDWDVRVDYGRRATIPLGKGAIRVEGTPPRKGERAAPSTRPASIAVVLLLVLALSGLAIAASRSASRGSPARPG